MSSRCTKFRGIPGLQPASLFPRVLFFSAFPAVTVPRLSIFSSTCALLFSPGLRFSSPSGFRGTRFQAGGVQSGAECAGHRELHGEMRFDSTGWIIL
ncbi:hypothetical protein NDU88_002601 [Pleurodeles waltl]|uniref:Transmembrane protein n=1 Tax=Pleurodeles waltl TaxID=8319 RepID=A0AAV7T2U0_PLEWA|nr:hypothetical protein NDU88_002601 [Pleurodeles waltl]